MATMTDDPRTSSSVCPTASQPAITSISSILYSGATSTTPLTWGCRA